jgi:superfamily II DNA/RNA helicase
LLRKSGAWRDDERIVVFTEYKTTLDYLVRRLRERYEDERILTLFGGMDELERDLVKQAFNDPAHRVRILLATDAARRPEPSAHRPLHASLRLSVESIETRAGNGRPTDTDRRAMSPCTTS